MHIVVVGLSHRTAPVELRERVDFQGRVESALRSLASRGTTHEMVVLSTCNRAELYAACEDAAAACADLARFMAEFHAVDPGALSPHVYDHSDLDAARHLLRVAAGLDSLVVGEPQILGQVKEAHTIASPVEPRAASARSAGSTRPWKSTRSRRSTGAVR
jgi:glutamyl-tRNA reductase